MYIVKTQQDIEQKLLPWLFKQNLLAYDIETTGLNVRKEKVIGFGLSNGVEGFYVAHLAWNGEFLEELLPLKKLQPILKLLLNKKLICWNASFDIRTTTNYTGVNLLPSLYSDAMLAFHTVQEEGVPFSHSPFGLKPAGKYFLGEDADAEKQELSLHLKEKGAGTNELYKADLAIIAKYCVQDTHLTYRLNEIFFDRMEKENLVDFFLNEEVMPLYREVTIPMESKGLPLDMPLLEKSYEEIKTDLASLEKAIHEALSPHLALFQKWFLNKDYPVKYSGPFLQAYAELLQAPLPRTKTGAYSFTEKALAALPDEHELKRFLNGAALGEQTVLAVQRLCHGGDPMPNLSSKHHLKKIFFDTLGEKAISFTDKGAPQVDEEFLDSISSKYHFVKLLIDYNKLTKIKGTYIERFLEAQEDGIYYPSFFQHRTISGRYGSDLQQMPRPLEPGQESEVVTKYTNLVRYFFRGQDGQVFVGADYESLEPKIFSHVSGDPRLQEIFHKGYDFYSHIAIMTEKLTQYSADKKAENYLGKKNKAKRQTAKSYCLGVPYGMSGYKLAFELNVSQDEAEGLVKNYLNAFPDLKAWMQRSLDQVCTKGFIRTQTGRVRRFPRAVKIYEKYGEAILNDLDLWKKYNKEPAIYEQAKKDRREFKNYVNNGNNIQIQGLAASLVNRASIAINRAFIEKDLDAKIVLQCHDELVVLCKETEQAEVVSIMRHCMENVAKLAVPLIAEPNVAKTYAETK